MGQPGETDAAGHRYMCLPPVLMLHSASLQPACRMEVLEKSHSAVKHIGNRREKPRCEKEE